MTGRSVSSVAERVAGWLAGRFRAALSARPLGWLEWSFLLLALVAAVMRLVELDQRAIHYDESLHLYYAWLLAQGTEYVHSPWMHGPFQIELLARVFRWVGDNDFVGRLPYALFGVVLTVLPYGFRRQLGAAGALAAGVLLAFSPSLLYFSRFGRNDILMAVWSSALLLLLFRTALASRRRYLFGAAAITALMLASKESSYFVLLFLGLASLGLGWRPLLEWLRRRRPLRTIEGPAGFFLLLATLTLPQAAAMAGALLQEPLGLSLVDTISQLDTGNPAWEAPFVTLPLRDAPGWLDGAAAAALLAAFLLPGLRPSLAAGWRGLGLRLLPAALLAGTWLLLCGDGIAWLAPILPEVVPVEQLAEGVLAVNYLVALLLLLLLFAAGAAVGLAWGGGVWLACAGVFYAIWIPLYTSFFANWPGIFSGSWQSLGYWYLQQEVARGEQPWYYYGVGLTVYELPALCFGLAGVVWLVRRREPTGLVLAGWAVASLVMYNIATERMPWLLVNMVAPLALVAGRLLGRLTEVLPPLGDWRRTGGSLAWSLAAAPACLVLAVGAAWLASGGGPGSFPGSLLTWLAGLALLPLLLWIGKLLRRGTETRAAAALGVAALLLVFSAVGAFRAAYTNDDSNREILAYAQGSSDLKTLYAELKEGPLAGLPPAGVVMVDWETRYPFQWYIRQETEAGSVDFSYFCPLTDAGETEGVTGCRLIGDDPGVRAYVVEASPVMMDADGYRRAGPNYNQVWHPETYRRPGGLETGMSWWEHLRADLGFFLDVAADPDSRRAVIEYFVTRHEDAAWYSDEFYTYVKARRRP